MVCPFEVASLNRVERIRNIRNRESVKGQGIGEPAIGVLVEVTARIGDKWPEAHPATDRGRIAQERVEIPHAGQRIARGVKHANRRIDNLHHKARADAEALIRWLKGELVPTIGQPLLAVVEAVKADRHLQLRGIVSALTLTTPAAAGAALVL